MRFKFGVARPEYSSVLDECFVGGFRELFRMTCFVIACLNIVIKANFVIMASCRFNKLSSKPSTVLDSFGLEEIRANGCDDASLGEFLKPGA